MNRIDLSHWTDPTDFDRNELVFEKRNKAYGAYLLRKNYNRTMFRALICSVFFILGICLIPKIGMLFAKENPDLELDGIIYDNTPPPPTKIEETPKTPEEAVKKIEKKMDPEMENIWKVIKDGKVDNDTLTMDEMNELKIGNIHNPDGDSTGENLFLYHEGSDSGTKLEVNVADPILIVVPEMPEYIGGEAALYRFLSENLNYPEYARDADKSGKIRVGFVVEKDGSISNIAILSSSEKGYGFEKEAERVMKIMPRWKPGRNNGHPARVYFNIPINFRLM